MKKNLHITVCELDLEKITKCGKIPNEQIFIASIYLFMGFIDIKSQLKST